MNWYRIKNRFISRMATVLPALGERLTDSYIPRESSPEIPWTPFTKPLSECRIALVTTAGVHHRNQKPFDMLDKEGDPSYRLLKAETQLDMLMITHDYYDHRDADKDINIVFPVKRLQEFVSEGIIKSLAAVNYSFMGHIIGTHIKTLVNSTAPEVARFLKRDRVDAVLLTPG